MGFVAIQAPRCQICRKSVYQAEQILHDEKPYHKSCFKCAKCKCQLTALNFAAFDGKLFCKTHFKELLANAGGKYDVAFQNDDDEKEGKKTDDEKKGEERVRSRGDGEDIREWREDCVSRRRGGEEVFRDVQSDFATG